MASISTNICTRPCSSTLVREGRRGMSRSALATGSRATATANSSVFIVKISDTTGLKMWPTARLYDGTPARVKPCTAT